MNTTAELSEVMKITLIFSFASIPEYPNYYQVEMEQNEQINFAVTTLQNFNQRYKELENQRWEAAAELISQQFDARGILPAAIAQKLNLDIPLNKIYVWIDESYRPSEPPILWEEAQIRAEKIRALIAAKEDLDKAIERITQGDFSVLPWSQAVA